MQAEPDPMPQLPSPPVPTAAQEDTTPARRQRAARLALAIGLAVLGVYTIHRYLPALVWAVILAIAVWPLYQRAERRWPPGRHNVLLPSLFTAAIALAVFVPLVLVAVQVAREAHDAVAWAQQATHDGVPAPQWLGSLPFGAQASAWWQAHLGDPEGVRDALGHFDRGALVGRSRLIAGQAVHRTVLFGFTLLTLFFLFRDGRALVDDLLAASRRAFGPHGERVGRQMVSSVHGTVDGLVLVGLGEGLIMGIAYVVAGVPHPAMLGALTAVAAMIPFGAAGAIALAALLVISQSVAWAVAIVVLGLVVVALADHAVRPALIGGATRLPFLWVLLGILGGVEGFGLLGLFLGPAVMAALVLLWRDYVARSSSEDLVDADRQSAPID